MPNYDFDEVLKHYSKNNHDFGFSGVSEEEYNSKIEGSVQTAEEVKNRLVEVERSILPFLQKLYDSADKEYIYWPNRKPIIEQQIKKILLLTRG
jgi:hypothetical protein